MNRGEVSTITGRRQDPALRTVAILAWLLAGMSLLGEGGPFSMAATIALILIIVTPLLRVGWLMYRWRQERDMRFVWTALTLLAVVAVGGAIALLA